MATSSFGKIFAIPENKTKEFLEEMKRETPPTLTKEFKSQFKTEKDAKELLDKILK